MLNRFRVIFCGVFLGAASVVNGQDPQFSQFYASPLYLNPAFAGSTDQARAGMNYRNQWPSMEANFVSYSAHFDYMFQDYNSGVGIMFMNDEASTSGLRSTSISLQYAYRLRLSRNWALRPGIQVAYTIKDANFNRFYFNSQWDPTLGAFVGPPPASDIVGGAKGYLDLSLGGLAYSKNAWLGASAHHLNQPNQSIVGEVDPLLMKISVHGGYRFQLGNGIVRQGYKEVFRERSFTPTFQYKFQGDFDQLDIGTYLTLEPMVLGMWYRGLPFKPYKGLRNNEAIVMLIGYTWQGLNMGYSYDYTISDLGSASGGAHEVSISYQFPLRDPSRPPRDKMSVPCPRF